jgi:hypothetical protein
VLTKTLELRRSRLAFRVDLAAIERFALRVIAEDFVGRANFRETLFRLRLFTLVGSGWYFLASLRNADLISAALAVFATPRTS